MWPFTRSLAARSVAVERIAPTLRAPALASPPSITVSAAAIAAPAPVVSLARHVMPSVPRPGSMARSFLGAKVDDLYADLPTAILSPNADLRPAIVILRARARHLEVNNDYAASYLMTGRRNVIGPQGIRLQMKVMHPPNTKGLVLPDTKANGLIEDGFDRWAKKATVDGISWRRAQALAWTVMRRDGEILVRLVSGYKGNAFRFAIEFIDVDRLDAQLNVARTALAAGVFKEAGNEIRMGVERDGYGKPVAYHILADHPADDIGWTWNGQRYVRVPAAEMIHVYDRRWVLAARGVTRFSSAIRRLQMLGGYEEAEVVAARIASAKGGFYEEEVATDIPGGDDQKNARGEPIAEVTPGQFDRLPPGLKFKPFDPQHPTTAFDPFVKAQVRGASAGMGAAYHEVSHDLSGANYSSLRQGALSDQDEWRTDQADLCEDFCQPVFEAWLSMALLTQEVPLPVTKFDKFNAATWRPRGWSWVDPAAEMKANAEALDRKLTSHRRLCAQQGIDFEELLDEIAADQALATSKGIDLTAPSASPADPLAAAGEEGGDGDSAALREQMDTYGIGVRAGALTPQQADEEHFRGLAGLPAASKGVKGVWSEEPVRRPITLAPADGGRAPPPSSSAPPAAAEEA